MFKRYLSLLSAALIVAGGISFSSCSKSFSGKSMCESNGTYQKRGHKRGQSKYSRKYGYKGTPTRKDYVIKNKGKAIVP